MADLLDKLIVARTTQGEFVGVGRCIAQSDQPTVLIEKKNGERIYWNESLTSVLCADKKAVDELCPRVSDPSKCPT